MTDRVQVSGEVPGKAGQRAEAERPPQFGLVTAMALIVAALSLVFSVLFIIYSRNTGHSFWVYWAPFFLAAGALLLGIPVYLAQRRYLTEPALVPPYR